MRALNFNWSLITVLAIATTLRFYALGAIPGPVFDEVFYPIFAINYLTGESFFSVHPPLGSYLIAIGIFLYDIFPFAEALEISGDALEKMNPISFRWLVALCGVCLVYVGYRLSLELVDSKFFAILTAVFFCIDGSLLVDSRLGLINVFFTLFGFIALLSFVKGIKSWKSGYFIFAGLSLGAAISVKWNGLGFWLLLILFSFQIFLIQKTLEQPKNSYKKILNFNLGNVSLIIVTPFVIYLLFWVPDLIHNQRSLIDQHTQMLSYHFENGEDKIHPYSSPWYSWPMMIRPIAYYFNAGYISGISANGNEIFQAIHLFPNPALNLFSMFAIILMTFKWFEAISFSLGNKTLHHELVVLSFICIGFYSNFLPWAIASRSTFIYHFQPAACFAFMALAYFLYQASKKKGLEQKVLVFGALTLVIISSIYWLPIQLGLPISGEEFYSRMWFSSWI